MLGRLKTSKTGSALPADWAESLARLLNETYKEQCQEEDRYFDVYGQIYPEELLLVVSYLSEKAEAVAPVTLFLSCDPSQISSEQKVKDTQKHYIEVAGLFFDEIFSNTDWNEFEPTWQEVTHNHQNYFYKISRENINHTLEANRLLGEEFEDVEFEEDDDEDDNE